MYLISKSNSWRASDQRNSLALFVRGTVPDVLKWVMVTDHRDLGPKHNIAELIQSPNDRIGLAFNGRPGTLGSRELVASKGQWVFPFLVQLPKVAPTATPLASVCKTNGSPTLGMRNT